MSVTVPEFVGTGRSWTLLDYVIADPRTTTVDASGVATIRCDSVPGDRLWQITRAVIACTGNVLPTLRLYVLPDGDDPVDMWLVSGSSSGLFDEADYPGDGQAVPEGQQLVAQWTGAQPGATATLRLQYRLLGR